MNFPNDIGIAQNGTMHEGKISTSLGLEGNPSVDEEIGFMRDISITKYTGGKLHFGIVSTNGALKAIKKA